MRKSMLMIAGLAVMAFAAASAHAADKKVLAIVVKGLDNPYFEQVHLGCEKWNTDNPTSDYTCLYTGPASSADEAGEVQIVNDLITKGVAGIAISPSNAPAMGTMLKAKPPMPIMTIDADLLPADAALRKTYLGTDNYLMGVDMAKEAMALKPKGATRRVCSSATPAAANINAARRRLPRHHRRCQGHRLRLTGAEGGWTEIAGCPVFTNDQTDLANQQMADIVHRASRCSAPSS